MLTPCVVNTRTTCALKPHCGALGDPFIKRTTGFDATSARTRSKTASAAGAAFARGAKSGCDSPVESNRDSGETERRSRRALRRDGTWRSSGSIFFTRRSADEPVAR